MPVERTVSSSGAVATIRQAAQPRHQAAVSSRRQAAPAALPPSLVSAVSLVGRAMREQIARLAVKRRPPDRNFRRWTLRFQRQSQNVRARRSGKAQEIEARVAPPSRKAPGILLRDQGLRQTLRSASVRSKLVGGDGLEPPTPSV